MVARIVIYLFIIIIFPFFYVDYGLMRKRWRNCFWKRLLWWLLCSGLLVYTDLLARLHSFAPMKTWILFLYMLIIGLVVLPVLVFAVCAMIGYIFRRTGVTRHNYGHHVGYVMAAVTFLTIAYGAFFGNKGVKIHNVAYYSEQLPSSFDGYRITLFSDLHVGSYIWGSISELERVVDAINDQNSQMIAFVGDLQNMHPDELLPAMPILSKLKAPDGVFSVLGNHDYGYYLHGDSATTVHNHQLMLERQKQMGWRLLLDENCAISRNGEKIYVAGMQNDGPVPIPSEGDPDLAMEGIPEGAFTVMLEHDPTSWRRTVLPDTEAQLTLSGHTHGGQIKVAGLSPASFIYEVFDGMFVEKDGRALFVTTGIGGFVPFRIGLTPEVVVITLHTKKADDSENNKSILQSIPSLLQYYLRDMRD